MQEPTATSLDPYLPLKGVRILSFEVAFSLPAGTRTLAELGADVVRVSGPPRADGEYISVVDGTYLSKSHIGLNLKHVNGRRLALQLARAADAVCYNFVPEVLRRLGLSPDVLTAEQPELIVLQLSGYGTPGPWADYPAYGPSTEATGGLNGLTGRDDDPPVRAGSGVFSDQLSGRFAALALVAAIEERQRTGKGAVIDLSMAEAISSLLGGFLVAAQRTGRQPERQANRHARYVPQGIYRCAGEDEWVAISVRNDGEWDSLVRAIGAPALEGDGLGSVEARQAAHDAIDDVIEAWTSERSKDSIAALLQEAGVAAGPVRKVQDALFDRHLLDRAFFQLVRHSEPYNGFLAHPHPRLPWLVEDHPPAELREIRAAGQDNERVLYDWLGLTEADVGRLTETGVLIRRDRVDFSDRPTPPGIPHDPDSGIRLRLPKE